MMFANRTNWNLEHNRLSEALREKRAGKQRLIDLTISNPTECGFHYDERGILEALGNPGALRYEPNPRGMETARRAVAGYYADRGEEIPLDDIFLTTSTSEAYSFVFRLLCNPGDEILIPQPGYPLFGFLADIQDVKAIGYPVFYDAPHGWRVDFRAMENAMTPRTRGVIVVHPNNPTGHFAKPEEMSRLSEACRVRGLAIIADEVFLDFTLGEVRPRSFAANAEALTFTMSGLSKIAGLPQMKAAWLLVSGPEALKCEAINRLEVLADTNLSMNAPIQLAMPALLEQRRDFQEQVMNRIQANLKELDKQLAAKKSCERMRIEGGWYAVLRVPGARSDEDTAIELLARQNVYVHPGHFYDFAGEGHVVVSLITREPDFAQGISRMLAEF